MERVVQNEVAGEKVEINPQYSKQCSDDLGRNGKQAVVANDADAQHRLVASAWPEDLILAFLVRSLVQVAAR